jgi:hypothetical protein
MTVSIGAEAPAVAEPADRPDPMVEVATALTLPFTLARQLLPDNPVPVVLGAGALAAAGVIEWPVAAAVGLGYLALRRWHRR